MLRTLNSKVIGGAFWTPGATILRALKNPDTTPLMWSLVDTDLMWNPLGTTLMWQ